MPGQFWTENEIEQLWGLLAQGFSASEMQIGSRSPAAIQNKAARLNYVGDGIPRKRWTAEAEAVKGKIEPFLAGTLEADKPTHTM